MSGLLAERESTVGPIPKPVMDYVGDQVFQDVLDPRIGPFKYIKSSRNSLRPQTVEPVELVDQWGSPFKKHQQTKKLELVGYRDFHDFLEREGKNYPPVDVGCLYDRKSLLLYRSSFNTLPIADQVYPSITVFSSGEATVTTATFIKGVDTGRGEFHNGWSGPETIVSSTVRVVLDYEFEGPIAPSWKDSYGEITFDKNKSWDDYCHRQTILSAQSRKDEDERVISSLDPRVQMALFDLLHPVARRVGDLIVPSEK